MSIDERYNFRFWDVRSLSCLQVIVNEMNAQVPIFGLFVFPGAADSDKFAVLSKRLLFFETKKKKNQAGEKQKDEQVSPLMVEFNQYYMSFSVVTSHDVRVYNARDGKLQKIIQNLLDPRTKAPLTAFCTDDRQRKFYVGDAAGAIRTYNISNGVFIKTVQHPFTRNASKPFDMVNEMDSHEISAVKFLHLQNHQCQLLVSAAWDSALQIFDEGEQPEESRVLRMAVGGHGREDISCLAVDTDLALIATGSVSGIVAVMPSATDSVGMGLRVHEGGALLHGAHEVDFIAALLVPAGGAGLHLQRGLRVLLGPEASTVRAPLQAPQEVKRAC